MLRSLYTASTGMQAQELRMDVISNNLANASTTGFKRTRAEFADLVAETLRPASAPTAEGGNAPTPLQVGLGVKAGSTVRAFTQGDMEATHNALDVAIEGPGFLRIQRPNGELGYTRAGNLRVDADGRMVTASGMLLDPEVSLPPDTARVEIRKDGTVLAHVPGRDAPQEVGALELAQFTNPAGLESLGENLFQATVASGEAQVTRPGQNGAGLLAQGFLEGSNVRAVEEMVDMISTQRSYELNSKVIQTADQMLQRLTNLR